MKKIIFFVFVILFGLSINVALATMPFSKPFGGRIIATNVPSNVDCPTSTDSPFVILPVTGPAYPWTVGPGIVTVGEIKPMAWILGLRYPSQMPFCILQAGQATTTYNTYFSNFYGTSSGFLD